MSEPRQSVVIESNVINARGKKLAGRCRPVAFFSAPQKFSGRFAERQRRPEHPLWQEFELARPQILGALLDVAAHGLHVLPRVRLKRLPRIADFALWATARESAERGALSRPGGAQGGLEFSKPGGFVRFYEKQADQEREWIDQRYSRAKQDPCDWRLSTRIRRKVSKLLKPYLY